jgi:membrane protein implicated in regulation of membrane protease activity
MFKFWLVSALILMLSEFLIPGMVVVFIGLGALTVVVGLHWSIINSIYSQLITFFSSSIIYCFTLRFVAFYFWPQDRVKTDLEKSLSSVGSQARALENIDVGESGGVLFEQSRWTAKNIGEATILKDDFVTILKQENISLAVRKDSLC